MKLAALFLTAAIAAPSLSSAATAESGIRLLLGDYEVISCLADGNTVSIPFKIHVNVSEKDDRLDAAINAYILKQITPAAAASSGKYTYVDVVGGLYNPYAPVLPYLGRLEEEIRTSTGINITPQFIMPGKLGQSKHCSPFVS